MNSRKPSGGYVPPERDGLEAKRYFQDVIDGKITTSQKVIKLAKKLIDRFDDGYKCWHYDAEKALRPVKFIERFIFISQGKVGKHLVLEDYELAFIETAFGFVDELGMRQFNEVLLIIARKNGKTELGAAISLYLMTKDGEFAPQLYSVATNKDQASLMYLSLIHI